jgi:hypothetical protein
MEWLCSLMLAPGCLKQASGQVKPGRLKDRVMIAIKFLIDLDLKDTPSDDKILSQ